MGFIYNAHTRKKMSNIGTDSRPFYVKPSEIRHIKLLGCRVIKIIIVKHMSNVGTQVRPFYVKLSETKEIYIFRIKVFTVSEAGVYPD